MGLRNAADCTSANIQCHGDIKHQLLSIKSFPETTMTADGKSAIWQTHPWWSGRDLYEEKRRNLGFFAKLKK
jgi:hypothetical protein